MTDGRRAGVGGEIATKDGPHDVLWHVGPMPAHLDGMRGLCRPIWMACARRKTYF
jgi:hypothetical protein